MGIRVLYDPAERLAALYDSVSVTAFGPLFDDTDQAEAYIGWVQTTYGVDARQLSTAAAEEAAKTFFALHVCATCDALVGDDHPAEWLRSDGTWTHDANDPTIPEDHR